MKMIKKKNFKNKLEYLNHVLQVNISNDGISDSKYMDILEKHFPRNLNFSKSNVRKQNLEKKISERIYLKMYQEDYYPKRSTEIGECDIVSYMSYQNEKVKAKIRFKAALDNLCIKDLMKCVEIIQDLCMEKACLQLDKLIHSNDNIGKSLFDRFWIITPEMFEQALNNSNSSQGKQLNYSVFHAGDCRLFVQIPVLVNSYLGRKSEMSNRETVSHYMEIAFKEMFAIRQNLNNK